MNFPKYSENQAIFPMTEPDSDIDNLEASNSTTESSFYTNATSDPFPEVIPSVPDVVTTEDNHEITLTSTSSTTPATMSTTTTATTTTTTTTTSTTTQLIRTTTGN